MGTVHNWAAALIHEISTRQSVDTVDAVKLHNLAYVCQGWHLEFTDHPAFEEPIVATFDGPHVPALAEVCGDGPIREPWPRGDIGLIPHKMNLVRDVARSYGAMTTEVLRGKMRWEVPWMEAWEASDYGNGPAQQIDTASIRDFFKEEAERTYRHQRIRQRLTWIETVEMERREWLPHT